MRERLIRDLEHDLLGRRTVGMSRVRLALPGSLLVLFATACNGASPAQVTNSQDHGPTAKAHSPLPSCLNVRKPPIYLIGLNGQPVTAVQFLSAENGWVVGSEGVLATSDGDQNWHLQYSKDAALQQVDFVNTEPLTEFPEYWKPPELFVME